MKECIVCSQDMLKVVETTPIMAQHIYNTVKQSILDKNHVDPCDYMVCELCWYGLMYNGVEYMWNGQDLMVFDEKEGEYVEPHKSVWKPSNPVAIQFEWCEISKMWVTMPRGG